MPRQAADRLAPLIPRALRQLRGAQRNRVRGRGGAQKPSPGDDDDDDDDDDNINPQVDWDTGHFFEAHG